MKLSDIEAVMSGFAYGLPVVLAGTLFVGAMPVALAESAPDTASAAAKITVPANVNPGAVLRGNEINAQWSQFDRMYGVPVNKWPVITIIDGGVNNSGIKECHSYTCGQ